MGDLDLATPRRLHVVGVGGAGMSAIAEVLAGMGHQVSGSDLLDSPVLERLGALGVDVRVGHDATHVGPDVEAVAVSTAISPGNPEVVVARERHIPVLRRAEVLAAICATRRTIAVAGTHGKTTTSAMLATVLDGTGRRPSFVVGGQLLDLGTGARWDEGEWLVVEADESDGTFLRLPVEIAVVTSVEPDHLEHWGSFDALARGFGDFLAGAQVAVACADDQEAGRLGREVEAVTYGFDPDADERILDYTADRSGCRFTIAGRGEVAVPMPGRHNALNATAALTAAVQAGVPFEEAAAAMGRFRGIGRRFQLRGERNGVTYVDEYAHLPGEVRASLATARDGGWRRIVCVFQPHRYSRTQALWRDFASAFDDADVLAVTELYPAGEPPRPGVTGKLVLQAVLDANPHRRVAWLPDRAGLVAFLRRELRPGDLCLT
ncbi:MAG: UDP-N-acetylmuramate--L-alanine ligase, partial [Actinomycetota bacterium]|nr:UDP-N-acetylmuramate--L-alanine ligase [Actinomycetota bacterium]